jgi:hypothetical protein
MYVYFCFLIYDVFFIFRVFMDKLGYQIRPRRPGNEREIKLLKRINKIHEA